MGGWICEVILDQVIRGIVEAYLGLRFLIVWKWLRDVKKWNAIVCRNYDPHSSVPFQDRFNSNLKYEFFRIVWKNILRDDYSFMFFLLVVQQFLKFINCQL